MNSFDSPVATVTNYMSIQERIQNIGKKPESLKQRNDGDQSDVVSSHSSGEITVNNLMHYLGAEEMTREQTALVGSQGAAENLIAEWQSGESQAVVEGEDERCLFDQMLAEPSAATMSARAAQPVTAENQSALFTTAYSTNHEAHDSNLHREAMKPNRQKTQIFRAKLHVHNNSGAKIAIKPSSSTQRIKMENKNRRYHLKHHEKSRFHLFLDAVSE